MKNLLNAMARLAPKPAAPAAAPPAATEADERWKRKLAESDAAAAKLRAELDAEKRRAAAAAAERDAERVRTTLLRAATAAGAVEPDDVADLVQRRVVLRDGKVVAADDPEKSADAVVAEFLAGKPAYVRAQVATGSGAPPRAAAAPPPPAPGAHDLTTREGATAHLHAQISARAARAVPPAAPTGTPPGRGAPH